MPKTKKKELKSEIIAFRVTASVKEKLENLAQKEKRELQDFLRLKIDELLVATNS